MNSPTETSIVRDLPRRPVYHAVKRATDLAAAIVGMLLGAPVWLGIGLLIKLTGPGPAIYSQLRVGFRGRPFRIYKFRSMIMDAHAQLKNLVDLDRLDVPGFKLRDDPRVTPLGRFLRRTGLDEVPQLWNVLRGEMSLVGPRPELPEFVARYTPEQRRRLEAKPGITGYQQVHARGKPLAGCIHLDMFYIGHQSLSLDLQILLQTVWVVLRGKGVA